VDIRPPREVQATTRLRRGAEGAHGSARKPISPRMIITKTGRN